MRNLAYSVIYPQPRKLMLGLVLALSLFTLTVNAQTVVRYNSNGEITASGDNIGAVQTTTGAAEGDVIKVSDGAVFNTSVTNPVSGFTVESATGNVVNVPVQAWYNFTQTPTDPFNATIRNISFTSADSYTSYFWNGNQTSLTCNNVTFTDFNVSVFNGIGDIQGNVSFVGNKSAASSGAIYKLKNLTGNNNKLTFSNNTANGTGYTAGGGAIYEITNFSGSGNTLEFSGNTAAKVGGAIYKLGNSSTTGLTGDNNKLTFSNNTANGTNYANGTSYTYNDGGGAIYELTSLGGSGNTLEFSENTAAFAGGAIYKLNNLSGEKNQLTFSKNTANGTVNEGGGGAIGYLVQLSGSGNTLDFSENTAREGGAIWRLGNSDGTLGLTGNNNQLTFSKNKSNGTGNADGGGAIYYLNYLSGSGNTLEFTGNTAARVGGAIHSLGVYVSQGIYSGGLTGDNNKLTFSNNTANCTGYGDGGGAIYRLPELSGSGNTLEFSENTAKNGGAICQLSNLSGSGNTLEFTGNTAAEWSGGAICYLGVYEPGEEVSGGLTGNNNQLTFSGNTAARGGGAILQLTNLSGSGNTLEFSGNSAEWSGGAIYRFGDLYSKLGLTGNNNQLTFSNNKANGTGDTDGGGAIYILPELSGSGNILEFSENTATSNGGAILYLKNLSGSGNTLLFEGNTAITDGGAIASFGEYGRSTGLTGSGNTLTFTGNTAGGNGGAIYSNYPITFSGNNTLTFTGNKAGTKGNDIYLYGYNNRPANLTFGGGTYSFDGGIWLAEYNGQTGTTTISNGAKVTIAGRNDDSVNEYAFANVALTANLTATLDDIEYLHGKFTVGENGLMTINKGDDTATIKSSTNYGVMDLLINKAEEVETISISSGRIDIKGYMDASIELQNDAELQSVASFSPGNSAGRLETTGDFIATAGSLLIFEQEGDVYDQLIANNVTIDPETGIDLSLFTTFAPGAVYDIIIANGTLSVDQSWIDMIQSGLPEFVEASIYNGNTVRLKIDANAVPEPSTWALLILGAAGLMYLRKRK